MPKYRDFTAPAFVGMRDVRWFGYHEGMSDKGNKILFSAEIVTPSRKKFGCIKSAASVDERRIASGTLLFSFLDL